MKKAIKDYLHLYLGCDVQFGYMQKIGRLTGGDERYGYQVFNPRNPIAPYHFVDSKHIKLLLRPLSDMTEKERMWFFNSLRRPHEGLDYSEWITEYNGNPVEPHWVLWVKDQRTKHGYTIGINNHFTAEQFRYLLSKGFDLFNLIPEGLAIDKTTLKQKV